jgi:hypothetical protein
MRHLSFGEKAVFVTDAVAEALIDLARALSDESRSESVTVDAVTEAGNRVRMTLLLTPATPLAAETTDVAFPLPADDAVVADLRTRTARVRGPAAREFGEEPPAVPGDFS